MGPNSTILPLGPYQAPEPSRALTAATTRQSILGYFTTPIPPLGLSEPSFNLVIVAEHFGLLHHHRGPHPICTGPSLVRITTNASMVIFDTTNSERAPEHPEVRHHHGPHAVCTGLSLVGIVYVTKAGLEALSLTVWNTSSTWQSMLGYLTTSHTPQGLPGFKPPNLAVCNLSST